MINDNEISKHKKRNSIPRDQKPSVAYSSQLNDEPHQRQKKQAKNEYVRPDSKRNIPTGGNERNTKSSILSESSLKSQKRTDNSEKNSKSSIKQSFDQKNIIRDYTSSYYEDAKENKSINHYPAFEKSIIGNNSDKTYDSRSKINTNAHVKQESKIHYSDNPEKDRYSEFEKKSASTANYDGHSISYGINNTSQISQNAYIKHESEMYSSPASSNGPSIIRYDEAKITLTKKEQDNFKKYAGAKLIEDTGFDAKTGQMDIEAYGALRRAGGNNSFMEGVKIVEKGDRTFNELCTTANQHTIVLTPQERNYYENAFEKKQEVYRNTGYDQVNGTISMDAYAGIRNAGGNFKKGVDLVSDGTVSFSRPQQEDTHLQQYANDPIASGQRIILSSAERDSFEKHIKSNSTVYQQCKYDSTSGTMDTGAYSSLKEMGGNGGFSRAIIHVSEKENFDLKSNTCDRVKLTPVENHFFRNLDPNSQVYKSASYDATEKTVDRATYAAIRNASGTSASFSSGIEKIKNGTLNYENNVYSDAAITQNPIEYHSHASSENTIQLTKTERKIFESEITASNPVYKKSGYNPDSGRMDIKAYSAIRHAGGEKGFTEGVSSVKRDVTLYDNLTYSASAIVVNLSESERKLFDDVEKKSQFKSSGYDNASGTMNVQAYAAIRDIGGEKGFAEGAKKVAQGKIELPADSYKYDPPQMFDKRQPEKVTIFASSKESNPASTSQTFNTPIQDGIFRNTWKSEHLIDTNVVTIRMSNTNVDKILSRSRIQLNKTDNALIRNDTAVQKALMIDENGSINAGLYEKLTQLGGSEGFSGGIELIRQGRLSFNDEKMGQAFLAVEVNPENHSYSFNVPDNSMSENTEYKTVNVSFVVSEDHVNYAKTLGNEAERNLLERSKIVLNAKESDVIYSSINKITEDRKAARLSQLDFNPKDRTINAAVYASVANIIKNKGLTLDQKTDFISGRAVKVDRDVQSKLESLGLTAAELKKKYDYDVTKKTLGQKGTEILVAVNKDKNITPSIVQTIKNQDIYNHKIHSGGATKRGGRLFFKQSELDDIERIRTLIAGGQRNGHGKSIGQENISKFEIVEEDEAIKRISRRTKTRMSGPDMFDEPSASDRIDENKHPFGGDSDNYSKRKRRSSQERYNDFPPDDRRESNEDYNNNSGNNPNNNKNNDKNNNKSGKRHRVIFSNGALIKITMMEKRVLKTGIMVMVPYVLSKMNDPQNDLNPGAGVNTMYSIAMTSYELLGIHVVKRAKNTISRPLESKMDAIIANYANHLIDSLRDLGEYVPEGLKGQALEDYANVMLRKLNKQKGVIPPEKFKELTRLYKELARVGQDGFSAYLNHLNAIIVENGGKAIPVGLRGLNLQKYALQQLIKILKNPSAFTESSYKILTKVFSQIIEAGKATAFKDVRKIGKFSRFKVLFNSVVKQLQKHGDLAGEGLSITMQMTRYATMAVKATLRVTKAVAQLARIAAKLSMKAAILAATGVRNLAEAHAATSAFAGAAANGAQSVINFLNAGSRKAHKASQTVQKAKSWMKDPFGIKSSVRNAVNRLKAKARKKIRDAVAKTWNRLTSKFRILGKIDKIFRKGAHGVGKIGKVFNVIGRVFSNIFNAISLVVHTIVNIVLLGFLLLLVIALIQAAFTMIISGIVGAFDFMNSDEDVQQACIQKLNELYNDDMSISSELSNNGYIVDNISYNTVRDDDAYTEKAADLDVESVSTTSNFGEILSMTLVRFDYDLDGSALDKFLGSRKNKILKYVEGMYYASHIVNVTKWTESTWIDTDGDGKADTEHKENHANVVYTTYYFNQIFDLSESTNGKHKTESTVDASSYIPDYDSATMEEIENAAYVYMRSAGFSSNGAAGTIAAIETLSGFDPSQNSNGYGIGCWGRIDKGKLKSWCSKEKYKSNSLEGQLRYFVHDMVSNASIASVVRDDDITAKEAAQVVAIKYFNIKKLNAPASETESLTE